VVNPAGRVMADSISVCGVPDRTYAERMAAQFARMPLRPARLNGQAVMTDVRIGYDF
jgi:hypothetical protein